MKFRLILVLLGLLSQFVFAKAPSFADFSSALVVVSKYYRSQQFNLICNLRAIRKSPYYGDRIARIARKSSVNFQQQALENWRVESSGSSFLAKPSKVAGFDSSEYSAHGRETRVDWKRCHERFPRADGYLQLSRLGKFGRYVVVYAEVVAPGKCGRGELFQLVFDGNNYSIDRKLLITQFDPVVRD